MQPWGSNAKWYIIDILWLVFLGISSQWVHETKENILKHLLILVNFIKFQLCRNTWDIRFDSEKCSIVDMCCLPQNIALAKAFWLF